MDVITNPYNFSQMHEAIQRYVDQNILSGASSVILKDNKVVDFKLWGYADIESQKAMAEDTIFRIYSNTKIITSVAAMCLYEDGKFDLDDPLEKYIPAFANLTVVKPGATSADEVEPLASKPTVRQVTCHNAGFSYGFLMESPVDAKYAEVNIMDPGASLADMMDKLATLPLSYQPGSRWQYSVSTDILARLVEIWSGQRFDEFLKDRIFKPLGMVDTDFYVPTDKHDRFATNYLPVDPMQPMQGGLTAQPDALLGSYLEPKAFMSGGGGLVSTIGDYTKFIQMLVGEGTYDETQILKSETVALMRTNQLPEGVDVILPTWPMVDTEFGIGLALKTAPAEGEPAGAVGEFHWGGMAGTHTWVAPNAGVAALIFTQRLPGFWHPFSHEYKRLVYAAVS